MNIGNLFDAIKGPLLTMASTLIPGGPLILGAVNALLPDDKKLPEAATGNDIRNAVNQLSPEQRSSFMEKKLDVEIAGIKSWTSIQESMALADSAGSSTRPWIAKLMAAGVFIAIMVFVAVWAGAIVSGDEKTLTALADSWPLMLAILATPTTLLRAYFGMRTKEKQARYAIASEQPKPNPLADMIKAFKG